MAPLLAAVIMSTSVSNSSTGGNVVSSGGTVENGASYSSVSVDTIDNGGVGTSTVQIQNDDNGQVSSQTITQPILPGVPITITVATSTGNSTAYVQVSANSGTSTVAYYARHGKNPLATTTASTTTSIGATTSVPFPALGAQGFDFFSFFRTIFSFFRW